MCAYIGAFDLILFAALGGDDDDLDASDPSQKRHGIADRPRCCPATVPAYHNMVQLERRFLDVRNDDKRSAESNSAASAMFSSTALVSGSACPTTARSKCRAIWPNWSPALTKLALSVSGSDLTPARVLAAVSGGFTRAARSLVRPNVENLSTLLPDELPIATTFVANLRDRNHALACFAQCSKAVGCHR